MGVIQDTVDERPCLETAADDAHGVAHAGCDHDLDGLRQEGALESGAGGEIVEDY
jgi:hypothetical protein